MVCRQRYGNPLGGARPKSASSVNATLPGALQETDYTLKFRLFGQAWGGGIRDAKYFLFRLKNIYAQTQGFTLEPSNPIYQCNRILCHNQAKRPPRRGRSLKVMSNEDNYFLVTEILANLLFPDVPPTVKVTEDALPSHLPSA